MFSYLYAIFVVFLLLLNDPKNYGQGIEKNGCSDVHQSIKA